MRSAETVLSFCKTAHHASILFKEFQSHVKTLIFNGSPRLRGDTMSLINAIIPKIEGECKLVNVCTSKIAPCIDCRYCWTNEGCAFIDEMQNVYNYIQDCDNIIIASPIYFSELTGQLLSAGSRLQTYFCARHLRNENPILKPKRGAVILVSGGDTDMSKAYSTACTLLHEMNCVDVLDAVTFQNTGVTPAIQSEGADEKLNKLIDYINGK